MQNELDWATFWKIRHISLATMVCIPLAFLAQMFVNTPEFRYDRLDPADQRLWIYKVLGENQLTEGKIREGILQRSGDRYHPSMATSNSLIGSMCAAGYLECSHTTDGSSLYKLADIAAIGN